MVGIWGPSGIGKTVIARTLFHGLAPRFQGSLFVDRAFLSKISETFSKANVDDYNMKLALQNKFLSEILGKKDIHIDQLGAIGERLKNQKVLLCIDDFDDQVVLDALAGNSEWFGSGSRIIVVTTDLRLLIAHEVNYIYPVDFPSNNQALKILCRAAFKKSSPPDGLEDFASEVVELAGRLPLGLHVLGSSLRGLEKEACLRMLPRLRRSLDGKIEKTLRVSYDGLGNKEDKAIFRHIACFLVGMKVKDIKLLFENSELDVEIGLRNLMDKSLINENNDVITMHRLLQEMGKEIVRGQSNKPGERESLWDENDIREVLEENNGTSKVLGIKWHLVKIDELNVHKCAFRKMRNLRYLEIYHTLINECEIVHVPKCFDYLPPTLGYFCWVNFPLRRMPSNFCQENLVRLEMVGSKLKKLWDGVVSLSRLRRMDLSRSENLEEIPDLSKAVNLEELILARCSSLVELPSSIQNLNKLMKLDMEYCTKLETLPTGINLESLDMLYMVGCSRLRIFPNISTNISMLYLQSTAIVRVPWWIEKFSRLQNLDMRYCSKLEYVHLNCSKLTHLQWANFDRCEALTRVDLRGYQNGVAMKANSASGFEKYFKWENNLRQQHVLVFRGEEVPSYFAHRTTGISLNNIPLLHTSLSQTSFKFRVCALISTFPRALITEVERVGINVNCRFRGLNEVFYSLGHHRRVFLFEGHSGSCRQLVIFDCCVDNVPLPKLTCNDVGVHTQIHADMQIQISSFYNFSLVEWGIRLIEDCSDKCDDDAEGNQGCSDDSDQCGGSDDSDDNAEGNQGGSDDSDQYVFEVVVFRSGTEHCNKCGWKEDNDEGNEVDQIYECDVFCGNWDTARLSFDNCYRLEVRDVRLLEDCSSEKHGSGAETIIYDGALNTTPQSAIKKIVQRLLFIGKSVIQALSKMFVKPLSESQR